MNVLDRIFDVLVVGSGAAGSIAAKELTERGLDVLVLKAGPGLADSDFVNTSKSGPKPLDMDIPPRARAFLSGQHMQARRAVHVPHVNHFLVNDRQNPYKTPRGEPYLWIRGRVLGGRLNTYGRVLMRMSDFDFAAGSHDGKSGDWPITSADIAPYYAVERFMGLYGSTNNVWSIPDGAYEHPAGLSTLEQQFKNHVEVTWPERRVIPWRYAAPNLGRTPRGIAAAQQTGRLTLRTNAVVRRVTVGRSGRADAVEFVDRVTKREFRAKANVIMLCASAIESVRLLLNSATDGHPDGLANSSGALGRYFMDQCPSIERRIYCGRTGLGARRLGAGGLLLRARWRTVRPSVPERRRRQRRRIRAWLRATRNPRPHTGPGRLPSRRGADGVRRDAALLRQPDHRPPPPQGRMGCPHPGDPVRHGQQRTVPPASASPQRARDARSQRLQHQLRRLDTRAGLPRRMARPRPCAFRALFRRTFPLSFRIGAAIHECGGARMGNDPATSVLNQHNQSWDIPNLFVTDASSFVTSGSVGPSLTIMALTARTCEHIAREYADGSI